MIQMMTAKLKDYFVYVYSLMRYRDILSLKDLLYNTRKMGGGKFTFRKSIFEKDAKNGFFNRLYSRV